MERTIWQKLVWNSGWYSKTLESISVTNLKPVRLRDASFSLSLCSQNLHSGASAKRLNPRNEGAQQDFGRMVFHLRGRNQTQIKSRDSLSENKQLHKALRILHFSVSKHALHTKTTGQVCFESLTNQNRKLVLETSMLFHGLIQSPSVVTFLYTVRNCFPPSFDDWKSTTASRFTFTRKVIPLAPQSPKPRMMKVILTRTTWSCIYKGMWRKILGYVCGTGTKQRPVRRNVWSESFQFQQKTLTVPTTDVWLMSWFWTECRDNTSMCRWKIARHTTKRNEQMEQFFLWREKHKKESSISESVHSCLAAWL